MDLTVRGATLPDGTRCDLFVAGSRLADTPAHGATAIDAEGLLVLPGLVDPHTHLRESGTLVDGELAETIATGTAAAARGGYTAVAAMPNTTPACNDPDDARRLISRARAVGASARVVPIGAVTRDRAGRRLADLTGLAQTGVRLFSDDGAAVATMELLRDALLAVRPFHGAVADHCQDPALAGPAAWCPTDDAEVPPDELWPIAAETAIVERDVQVAAETGGHVHLCHLSTAASVDVVRWAKARGAPVTAEVTPHHLFFTSDALNGTADPARFKVNPPLRSDEDVEALRDALADGTIDMIATDHAPHTMAAKNKPLRDAAPGLTGLEQALGVVIETMIITGRIDWADVVRLMSQNPARLLHLHNQGRRLTPGSPATFTLVDPARRAVVRAVDSRSLARNNPYDGLELPDPVVMTVWAGRVTYSAR